MRLVRSLAACAVIVGGLAAGCSSQQTPQRHVAPITISALPQRFFPHPSPSNTEPITFHGGQVMTGATKLYLIWYGPWGSAAQRRRRALVTEFVRSLDSPWWAISGGYTNAAGQAVGHAPVLAGEVTDSGSVGTSRLTDPQIQRVVQRALALKVLPLDANAIYMVATSSAVTKVGFLTQYCGWHSWFRNGAVQVKFSFVGDPTGPLLQNCSPQSQSPNGDVGGDAMASTIAHELTETVTDPTMRGWRTARGEENADRCAWQYGKVRHLSNGAYANMKLGARDWLIQTNWLNTSSAHCALA